MRAFDSTDSIASEPLDQLARWPVCIPIVAIEVEALSPGYPIVWAANGADLQLSALAFLTEGPNSPGRRKRVAAAGEPLLVGAYPLVIGSEAADDAFEVLIDDPGSDGDRPGLSTRADGRSAETRLNKLRVFMADRRRTEALTAALLERGLLEDWAVRLKIGEGGVDLSGLKILKRDWRADPALEDAIARVGFPLAELAFLHELSLFNMQTLVEFHHREVTLAADGS